MPEALPVKVTVVAQDALCAPALVRVQLPLVGDTPAPLAEKLTVPWGTLPPDVVSVTVALQALPCPMTTVLGLQLTVVFVVRWLVTVNAGLVVPELSLNLLV